MMPSLYDFAQCLGAQFGISHEESNFGTLIKAIHEAAHGGDSRQVREPRHINGAQMVKFREIIRKYGFSGFDYIEEDVKDLACLRKTFHVSGERQWWGRRWVVQGRFLYSLLFLIS